MQDGPNPDDQVLTIRNSGGGTLNWEITETCDWLTASPTIGNSAGEPNYVTISVDISGLDWGIYDCNMTISDPCAINSPQYVNVTLDITGPIIELSSSDFEFYAYQDGTNPDDQILTIQNAGGGTLYWLVDCNSPWLEVEPTTGSSMGEPNNVTLSVDTSGVSGGIHTYQLTVFDPNAENSPQTIDVSLYIPVEVLVPDDYTTIQAAIDSVESIPALITVEPGTYYENIIIDNDEYIKLRSSNPSDPVVITSTIIDGGLSNSVIRILGCDTVIDGFVITHGKADNGGGIYCTGTADVSIKNCIIDDNKANNGADGYWYFDPVGNRYVCFDGENGGSGGGHLLFRKHRLANHKFCNQQ
jgi:hypothetical protein